MKSFAAVVGIAVALGSGSGSGGARPGGWVETPGVHLCVGDTLRYSLPGGESAVSRVVEAALSAVGSRRIGWGITLSGEGIDPLGVQAQAGEDGKAGEFDTAVKLRITITLGDSIVIESREAKNATTTTGTNHIKIVNDVNGRVEVMIGRERLSTLLSLETTPGIYSEISITASEETILERIRAGAIEGGRYESSGFATEDEIAERVSTGFDIREGIWRQIDYTADMAAARPGGCYRLATVGSGDGGYDIIYIDGAEIYPDCWRTGTIKGRLMATPIEGVYDLRWIDATGKEIWRDASATFEDNLLYLAFPRLNATLRLARERP